MKPQTRNEAIDVLSGGDKRENGRFALSLVLAVLSICAFLAVIRGFNAFAPEATENDESDELIFVEVAEPESEPEPVIEIAPEPEPESVIEPEPEPDPVVEPEPRPEPEPVVEREPEPVPERLERPESRDIPEGEPQKLEENERPLEIGLEGESFNEGASGPVFARGDSARGGRPGRRSTNESDERVAVAGATRDGTGDRPARRPEARGTGGAGGESRNPRRSAGVGLPQYPSTAQEREVEGECSARITVGVDGAVGGVRSLQCSPSEFGFEESFRQWLTVRLRFSPALQDGAPVQTEITYRHSFRLP